jgi:MFS transporter, DHA1 family, multidrug resistance protein
MDKPAGAHYAGEMTPRASVRFMDRTTPPHIVTLVFLAGLGALSMNIFLPSLPVMAAHFDAPYRLIQLSVALYLGVNAVLQVFIGPISDRFGRRPVMLGSIIVFVLATIGTLLATSVEVFLAFRAVQAVIVAGLVVGRAVVRDMVPQEEAASMIGYVTMGMAVVPMVGPMVGGLLEELFAWQASFVLLLACGVLVLWLAWADMGETAVHRSSSFAAQFRQYPELLTAPRFWGYTLTAAFASGAFFAYLGGAPYVGSEVFSLSPAALGFYFGAPALGYAAGNFISGRYSVRFGINRMVLWGTLLTCAGLAVLLGLDIAGARHPAVFFGFMTFVGLGNGMVLPNATAGMLSVRPRLAGSASGLGGAIMIGGGAALSALAGAMLTPGSGAGPLVWLMFATSLAAVGAILSVIRRERRTGLA